MATREQITHERLFALITELGEAGVISKEESDQLSNSVVFGQAEQARKNTPEPPAVTRKKVGDSTKTRFESAYESGDTMKALAVMWEVLTGEDVTNST